MRKIAKNYSIARLMPWMNGSEELMWKETQIYIIKKMKERKKNLTSRTCQLPRKEEFRHEISTPEDNGWNYFTSKGNTEVVFIEENQGEILDTVRYILKVPVKVSFWDQTNRFI